jgi:hypothetical protein
MDEASESSKKPPHPRRRLRWAIGVGVALPVLALAAWVAVHRIEWLGPMVANSLRAVLGTDAVAKIEDTVYAVEDRFNRVWRKDEKPKAYWQVPTGTTATAAPPPAPANDAASAAPVPVVRPKDPGPMHKSWSAPGDGVWLPIRDPRRPQEEPYMWKTLLHPDPNRSWSELFVVAIDVGRTRLHVVAGRNEPKSKEPEAQTYKRIGHIPEQHHEELLAAFNGGFMTEHGFYGMKVDDVVLVKPRDNACTIAAYADDSLRIGSWKNLADGEKDMAWYRQAPACMYENGKLHPGLQAGSSAHWGATLDGETVIRRSAIGLNAKRDILFVAISNHTNARAIASGVFHAGATDVAQLDVNWSYPKFVLFEPGEAGPQRKAVALAPGFEFSEDEYIRKRSIRDFFYVMRRSAGADANQN